jgi:hypothetical protein
MKYQSHKNKRLVTNSKYRNSMAWTTSSIQIKINRITIKMYKFNLKMSNKQTYEKYKK